MHVVVIRRDLYLAHRWVAQSLFKGFVEAQRMAYEDLHQTAALKVMLPWLIRHRGGHGEGDGPRFLGVRLRAECRCASRRCFAITTSRGLSRRQLKPQEIFAPDAERVEDLMRRSVDVMSIPGDPQQWRVGLVGYGEVGRILAEDLRTRGVAVAVYDVKLGTAAETPLRQHAAQHDVSLTRTHAELASQADFIVSAVTASQTVAVAESCAPAVKRDAFFLDFNSASPGAKIKAAGLVNAGGARYVEGAVMTAIAQYRIRVPLLLGGPSAAALHPLLSRSGSMRRSPRRSWASRRRRRCAAA